MLESVPPLPPVQLIRVMELYAVASSLGSLWHTSALLSNFLLILRLPSFLFHVQLIRLMDLYAGTGGLASQRHLSPPNCVSTSF